MKLFSEHEVDIRLMKAGRRIRIVGTRPTIMLSINDVFRGWFANPDDAWKALEDRQNPSTSKPLNDFSRR